MIFLLLAWFGAPPETLAGFAIASIIVGLAHLDLPRREARGW